MSAQQVTFVHPDWLDRAECRDADPSLFFVGPAGDVRPAQRICARCPVREECLAYALEMNIVDGVWGGLSESQRARLRPGFIHAPRVCVYCGQSFQPRRREQKHCGTRCGHLAALQRARRAR